MTSAIRALAGLPPERGAGFLRQRCRHQIIVDAE